MKNKLNVSSNEFSQKINSILDVSKKENLLKKIVWKKQDDEILLQLIKSYDKKKNWEEIAKKFNESTNYYGKQRTAYGCRKRYIYILQNRNKNILDFNSEELKLLIEKQALYGNQWKIIKEFFINRSESFLKNQYENWLRKHIRTNIKILEHEKHVKFDCSYNYKIGDIRAIVKIINEKKLRSNQINKEKINQLIFEYNRKSFFNLFVLMFFNYIVRKEFLKSNNKEINENEKALNLESREKLKEKNVSSIINFESNNKILEQNLEYISQTDNKTNIFPDNNYSYKNKNFNNKKNSQIENESLKLEKIIDNSEKFNQTPQFYKDNIEDDQRFVKSNFLSNQYDFSLQSSNKEISPKNLNIQQNIVRNEKDIIKTKLPENVNNNRTNSPKSEFNYNNTYISKTYNFNSNQKEKYKNNSDYEMNYQKYNPILDNIYYDFNLIPNQYGNNPNYDLYIINKLIQSDYKVQMLFKENLNLIESEKSLKEKLEQLNFRFSLLREEYLNLLILSKKEPK